MGLIFTSAPITMFTNKLANYWGQFNTYWGWLLGLIQCVLGPIFWTYFCLPKGRHSEGPHEIHPISSQKCSRGGVCHVGVGCVMQGWGGVCHAGVGWGVSYRGGEGCVMQGWGVSCRGGVECMTHPSPPLHDTPPTPTWHPHPYMTHPTPGTFLGRNGMDFMGSFTVSPFC